MPRPRSEHVSLVKAKLIARIVDGFHQPGDRFLSARAIAQQFEVSYQTADRLLKELEHEGHLNRRAASGTYLTGTAGRAAGVRLIFNERARRAGSFGSRLLEAVRSRLRQGGVAHRVQYVPSGVRVKVAGGEYPVLWEVARPAGATRALVLNDRPPVGLEALHTDAISIDDHLGGACAAELLTRRVGRHARLAILAGPIDDARSNARVSGFESHAAARRVHSDSWFYDDALPIAMKLFENKPDGVFACNDRLAHAVITAASRLGLPTPALIGFDDAPIAETLHLSTISIPWSEFASAVATTVQRRVAGDASTPHRLILAPRPITRLT
jgi:DNA-binding transcriptional regulator YhcF (GntR family)